MTKNRSTYSNDSSLGCCGCKAGSGLAGASAEENSTAEKTKQDVVKTAKDYINDEIPTKWKIGAGALIAGAIWWRSRCK